MVEEKDSMLFCYVACGNNEEAVAIAKNVVEKRLAACGNILDGMKSIYWWEGKVVEDQECILILKTREELFEQLNQAICDLHSYDCPCVVAMPIEKSNPPYLQWLMHETIGSR